MKTLKADIISILDSTFHQKALLSSIINCYEGANIKYMEQDWEGVAVKAGKCIEAITKLLLLYCGQSIPPSRRFKATNLLKSLEPLSFPDTIRIAIPKAGIFIYEVANNRGGRHHSDDIDANKSDSKGIMSALTWIIAELIRFASISDPDSATSIIEAIGSKTFPLFEKIDDRIYINCDKLSAKDIAMLILYYSFPERISRQDLIDQIVRHGASKNAANIAATTIKKYIDDDGSAWKLRGLGRTKAETILGQIK